MITMTATLVIPEDEPVSMEALKDFVSQVDNGSAALNDAEIQIELVGDPVSGEPALYASWTV